MAFGAEPLSKLFVSIGANVDQFDRALGHVDRGMQNAAKSAAQSTSALAKVEQRTNSLGRAFATLGGILATIGIVKMGKDMIGMAMDAVESENLFEVSMGGMAASARAWSEQLGESLKINDYALRKAMGTFNVMATSMGLPTNAAYELAKGVTQLSYDFASFYNLPIEEAFLKMQSGLAGESEPLRRLGIDISETTVKNWALTHGLIQQGEELSQAGKMWARYNVLLEQSSAAQGDLARTIDSPANRLRAFKEQWDKLSISIGKVFLPVVSEALAWLNDIGMPAVEKGLGSLQLAWGQMGDEARNRVLLIAGLLIAGGPLIGAVGIAIKGVAALANAFSILAVVAKTKLNLVAVAVGIVAGIIWQFMEGIGDGVGVLGLQLANLGSTVQRLPGMFALGMGITEAGASLIGWGGALKKARQEIGGIDAVAKLAAEETDDLFGNLLTGIKDASPEWLIEQYENLKALIDGLSKGPPMTPKAREEADMLAVANKALKSTIEEVNKLQMPKTPADFADWGKAIAQGAEKGAQQAKMAIGQVIDALKALHPAAIAAAAAVAAIGQRIADVNLALIANRDQLRAAQDEYSKMGDRLAELNQQLSEAQTRLDKLAQPKLKGMGEMETQMRWVQDQLNRMKLARTMRLPMSEIEKMFPAMSEAQKAFLSALPKTEGALERFLEMLRLQYGLKFDEQLALIGEAAGEAEEELSFEDAIKAIGATKAEIDKLTGAVDAQKAAMAAQKELVDSLQRAMESLNGVLDALKGQLEEAERKQKLVNDALELALGWFIKDRQAMIDMGGAAADQVPIIDAAMTSLLGSVDASVLATTISGTTAITDMQTAYTTAITAINLALATIPTEKTITVTTIYKEPVEEYYDPDTDTVRTRPKRASGGLVTAGIPYLVGEQGRELFVPNRNGSIIPAPQTRELMTASETAKPIVVQFTGPIYANDLQQVEVMAYRVAQKIQERRR